MQTSVGDLCLVLHAHLPYVRHPEKDVFLEEDWFFEAMTETYIPLLEMLSRLAVLPIALICTPSNIQGLPTSNLFNMRVSAVMVILVKPLPVNSRLLEAPSSNPLLELRSQYPSTKLLYMLAPPSDTGSPVFPGAVSTNLAVTPPPVVGVKVTNKGL